MQLQIDANVQSKAGSKGNLSSVHQVDVISLEKRNKNVGSSSRRNLTGRTGDGGDGAERPAKADRDQGHQMIAVRPASLLHIFVPLCVTINYFIYIIPSAFCFFGR